MTVFNLKLLASAITALCFLPAFGQETIVLKNGSRLHGHTSIENFENWTISFMTDSATVTEKLDNVIYTPPTVTRLYEVGSNYWRRWFEQNPQYIFNNNGHKSVRLGNVNYLNRDTANFGGEALIREIGPDNVTFFTPMMLTVTIDKNKDVDHYEYDTRNPLALVGTVTEIVPVNGTPLKGQIVADYPSRLVLLTDDGIRHVIPYSNIRIKRTLPYNTARPLAEQMKFLSRINYRNRATGKIETLNGVIIREIVYKPLNNESPYYEIVNTEGLNPVKLDFDDVITLRLSPNNQYVEDLDLVINDDDLLIEGQLANSLPYTLKTDRYELTDTVGATHVRFSELNNGHLKVSYKDLPVNADFIFAELKSDDDNAGKSSTQVYYSRLSDMVLSSFSATDRFISPNMNISVSYGPVRPGRAYMILRRSDPRKPVYIVFVE